MRIFGNIIWHLFCFGWLTSLISVLFGALFSITGFLTPITLELIIRIIGIFSPVGCAAGYF